MVLLEELEHAGREIEFLDRPMSHDPHDQLLLQIRGAMAEYERTRIAEPRSVRRGRQTKLRAGVLPPWTWAPYGYRMSPDRSRDPAGVQVDAAEAGVVQLMFAWYAEDHTRGPTVHTKWLTHFNSHSGKALLLKSPWELWSDFYERVTPDPAKGEFWLTTGRINEMWQSGFDDHRKPYMHNRWPDTWVEIHPEDAAKYGVESGDLVRMFSDDIQVQTGGWVRVKGYKFTDLVKAGLIRSGKGEAVAVAIVSEDVLPGLLFTNFLHPASPANSLVHRVPDPFANVHRFKLGKAQIEKIGESPYKKSLEEMTFKPRTVTFTG